MKSEYRLCTACDDPISDKYVLEVGGHSWHGSCLRCCMCMLSLDQQTTCFVKDHQIYCKADYIKSFGAKCARCCRVISSTDWVRRAREHVFHLACFACDTCGRQLSTGEQFALVGDQILCREHYMETVESETGSSDDGLDEDGNSKKKIKRVRTAFTEEQLQILQTNFEIDSNPDGHDLERIATIAGLSKRVTQVWFQNARARQKKYTTTGKRKNPYEINLQLTTNVLL